MYEKQYSESVPFGPSTEKAKEIILEADRQILRQIERSGGFEKYVQTLPELKRAFTHDKPFLCCMDERTAKGTIQIPGSGILMETEREQKAFAEKLKEAGIEGVYSHDNCGAVKIYAKKHGVIDYNAAAAAYSRDLANKLDVKYLGHLKTSGEHPGRAVYIDATGALDKGSSVWQEKMPTGFGVSRNVLDAQNAREAIVLAVQVAFSEHGYGPTFFSEQDPLSLISITSPANSENHQEHTADALRHELELCYQAIVDILPEARGKIRIDGFTAPIEGEKTPLEELRLAA